MHETDPYVINLSKKVQEILSELNELKKTDDRWDLKTGRYCGTNNRIKYLEASLDECYIKLLNKYKNLIHYCIKIKFRIPPVVGYDDIVAVAEAGLYKGFLRYDPSISKAVTFLTRTMIGEIKRYFRDYCWRWKVPRKLKEASTSLGDISKIAKEFNLEEEEIKKIQEILKSDIPYEEYYEVMDNNDSSIKEKLHNEMLTKSILSKLDPIEEQVIIYKIIEDRSISDIADLMFSDSSKIKKILDDALIKLQDIYKGHIEYER